MRRLTRVPLVLLALSLAGAALPSSASAGSVLVLCDHRTFDGYTKPPFRLSGGVYADPNVLKVIRSCTFRHASVAAIRLENARNVLIEGNLFYDIRTGVPGVGVSAVAILGASASDNITLRGNHFWEIGADGVQLAGSGRLVSNVRIEWNTFTGSEAVGENAIDVKGVNGPVLIRANTWSGFRPCQSPRLGGTQDCTGSSGAGVVVHHDAASGRPRNVSLIANTAINNTAALAVWNSDIVTVSGNTFKYSLAWQLSMRYLTGCRLGANTYVGSATRLIIKSTDC